MRCDIILLDPLCYPEYAHFGDAGADFKSTIDVEVRPNEVKMIGTGVCIAIPYGFGGFLMSRSGHGKIKISLANRVGLIDHQFRDEVKCLITNEGDNTFKIKKYDRIAQLVLVPVMMPSFNVVDKLSQTERGHNGFGSTGS